MAVACAHGQTRTTAAELVIQGYVRVNAKRIEQAARPIGIGDVLTIAFPNRVVVLEVLGIAERRGSYPEASKLYRCLEEDAAQRSASVRRGEEKPGLISETRLPREAGAFLFEA